MSTVGGWSFGERDNCGRRLDGGVEVRRGGVFGIVVRIVKCWYRRLRHKWGGRGDGGVRGSTERKKEEKKKDGKVSRRPGGRLRGRHATLISFTIFGQGQLVK